MLQLFFKSSYKHLFLPLTATALLYQFALYAQTADGNNGAPVKVA